MCLSVCLCLCLYLCVCVCVSVRECDWLCVTEISPDARLTYLLKSSRHRRSDANKTFLTYVTMHIRESALFRKQSGEANYPPPPPPHPPIRPLTFPLYAAECESLTAFCRQHKPQAAKFTHSLLSLELRPDQFTYTLFSFFHGALRPQELYGLLGTGTGGDRVHMSSSFQSSEEIVSHRQNLKQQKTTIEQQQQKQNKVKEVVTLSQCELSTELVHSDNCLFQQLCGTKSQRQCQSEKQG